MGDIGQVFSDKNNKFKNIRSTKLLKKVIKNIKKKNYSVNNIDINIITEKPKIAKYKYKLAPGPEYKYNACGRGVFIL